MASVVRKTSCTTESWVFTQWICCLHVKEPYKCKILTDNVLMLVTLLQESVW